MTTSGGEEREIKARVDELDVVRARLEALGGASEGCAIVEEDVLFDTADGAISARGCALRLRRARPEGGGSATARLTWKGPARHEDGAKVREEVETDVGDADAIELVLARLGLTPAFRYSKRRRSFALRGATVTLDETEVGTFVEVEGPADVVGDLARDIGLDASSFERRSYPELVREQRASA